MVQLDIQRTLIIGSTHTLMTLCLKSFIVSFTYLDDWMFSNNFTIDRTHQDFRRILTYDLHYVSPQPIEIPLANTKIRTRVYAQQRGEFNRSLL